MPFGTQIHSPGACEALNQSRKRSPANTWETIDPSLLHCLSGLSRHPLNVLRLPKHLPIVRWQRD
jgi:hypothetical protein